MNLKSFLIQYRENRFQLGVIFIVFTALNILSSYMYHVEGTGPAVIFSTQGLAFAAALVYGYTAIPVTTFGVFLGALYADLPWPLLLLIPAANFFQVAFTLFVVDKFKVDRLLSNTWDFYKYIAIVFLTSTIAPTFNVYGRVLYNALASDPINEVVWGNLWVASLDSVLILTPFLVRLMRPSRRFSKAEWIENSAILIVLNIVTGVLTYTPNTALLGINLLIPFMILLMWSALRGGTFFVTLAMVTVSVSAISGRILGSPANPQGLSLADQIVQTQTSLIIFSLLFYFIAALEEARRSSALKLSEYTKNLEKTVSKKKLDEESKNHFIATLGHEMRNPLASLLSLVEVLKFKAVSKTEHENILNSMEKNVLSMERMLDDVLDISRITKNKIVLKKEVIQARKVLKEAANVVESRITDKEQCFSLKLPGKNIMIEADPIRMGQIVTNLLNNASKFTEPGGTIELLSELEKKDEGHMLVIKVRDTGVGLAEDEILRIFEPFTQINPDRSLTGSIGLGLTLAHDLVKLHNGTIHVSSEGIGCGSEFIVRIPAILEVAPALNNVVTQPVLPISLLQKNSILVVDDNVNAAQAMGKLLIAHKYDVALAHNGQEALEKARELRPGVILLDIGLPDISGYDVAKQLRAEESPSLLVALSGYGPDYDQENSDQAQFDEYLVKPASIQDIIKAIGPAISQSVPSAL